MVAPGEIASTTAAPAAIGRYFHGVNNEDWDDFEVAAAEKMGEGDDYRVVTYLFTYLNVGPSWKTLHKWHSRRRIVHDRILKENIAK